MRSGRAPAATAAGLRRASQGAGHDSIAEPQLCPSSSLRPPKGTGNLSQGFHSQAFPAERYGSCGCMRSEVAEGQQSCYPKTV